MIFFDPTSKTVASGAIPKKSSVKEKDSKVRFGTSKKLAETAGGLDAREVADIAPMLFLQEIDSYSEDKDYLDQFAKKAFKNLKALQMAIIKGELNEINLHNLQNTFDNNKHKFSSPELESLANEISTRVAVEIAKLEMLRSK